MCVCVHSCVCMCVRPCRAEVFILPPWKVPSKFGSSMAVHYLSPFLVSQNKACASLKRSGGGFI